MKPKRPHPQLTHEFPCASRYRAPYFEELDDAIAPGLIFEVNQSGGSIRHQLIPTLDYCVFQGAIERNGLHCL